MTKLGLSIALAISLVGCGTDNEPSGPERLPDLEVPPKPENGLQTITPIVRDIQPGSDNEICTWTDAIVDRDTDVRSTLATQTEPGHHVVVYYTDVVQPAGTQRPCTDQDMASFRFLTGNGKEGEPTEAPGNLVFRIPAGSQIVVNHHYLNASDKVMEGQSAVNLYFADKGGTYIPSSSTAFLNTDLNIKTGTDELKIHCVMEQAMKFWYFIPHMHRWGANIAVDITKGGQKTRLFDTAWTDDLTFHPPEMRKDPAEPMALAVGDQVDLHCVWNNDTGHVLNFGFEMCVAFGQYVDDTGIGSRACDNGRWVEF